MVFIFGWGAGPTQDLGEVAPVVCPNCHNQVFLHEIRSDKSFNLWFVPIVPYGSDQYLACPICKTGIQLNPGNANAVTAMKASTALMRRNAMPIELYRVKVESFWRQLGVAPSGEQVVLPSPTIPPPVPKVAATADLGPAPGTLAHKLESLAKLHADGTLNDEEFAAAKGRLLGS